jgi:hypothetical protein
MLAMQPAVLEITHQPGSIMFRSDMRKIRTGLPSRAMDAVTSNTAVFVKQQMACKHRLRGFCRNVAIGARAPAMVRQMTVTAAIAAVPIVPFLF